MIYLKGSAYYFFSNRKCDVMKKNSGFTLVEIVVVIALLGVVMTIAIPNIYKFRESSNKKAYNNKKAAIEAAAANYAQRNGFSILDDITTTGNSSRCDLGYSISSTVSFTCNMSIETLVGLGAYVESNKVNNGTCLVSNPKGGCIETTKMLRIDISQEIAYAEASLIDK